MPEGFERPPFPPSPGEGLPSEDNIPEALPADDGSVSPGMPVEEEPLDVLPADQEGEAGEQEEILDAVPADAAQEEIVEEETFGEASLEAKRAQLEQIKTRLAEEMSGGQERLAALYDRYQTLYGTTQRYVETLPMEVAEGPRNTLAVMDTKVRPGIEQQSAHYAYYNEQVQAMLDTIIPEFATMEDLQRIEASNEQYFARLKQGEAALAASLDRAEEKLKRLGLL